MDEGGESIEWMLVSVYRRVDHVLIFAGNNVTRFTPESQHLEAILIFTAASGEPFMGCVLPERIVYA